MYTQKIQITHTKRGLSSTTKSTYKISNSSDTDNEKTVKTMKKPVKTMKTTHHKYATKLDKHTQTKNLWHMKNTSDVARLSLRNNQTYIDD